MVMCYVIVLGIMISGAGRLLYAVGSVLRRCRRTGARSPEHFHYAGRPI